MVHVETTCTILVLNFQFYNSFVTTNSLVRMSTNAKVLEYGGFVLNVRTYLQYGALQYVW